MADKEDGFHIYGTADPENRQPAPDRGLRGEQGTPLAEPAANLTHREQGEDGRVLTIQESSGVAFVEATGAVDTPPARDPDQESRMPPVKDAAPRLSGMTGPLRVESRQAVMLGVGVVAMAGGIAALAASRRRVRAARSSTPQGDAEVRRSAESGALAAQPSTPIASARPSQDMPGERTQPW